MYRIVGKGQCNRVVQLMMTAGNWGEKKNAVDDTVYPSKKLFSSCTPPQGGQRSGEATEHHLVSCSRTLEHLCEQDL